MSLAQIRAVVITGHEMFHDSKEGNGLYMERFRTVVEFKFQSKAALTILVMWPSGLCERGCVDDGGVGQWLPAEFIDAGDLQDLEWRLVYSIMD